MSGKAIVFAGQGAQFVGMGKDLAGAYPECKELFDRADEVLGYKLSDICFAGPESELTKTNHCQPAIFVVSMACYKALCLEAGGAPEVVGAAGLSLGEWTALHMAGSLGFEDTVRILASRGEFMQDACDEREGSMVSVIGLADELVAEVCEKAGVEVSNLNSVGQTVLSGEKAAIEEAAKLAGEAGAKKTIVLKVAGAYHSSLMSSAAERLSEVLGGVEFCDPSVPVLANATGMPHGGAAAIGSNMIKQVTETVKWVSCIEWFKANGVNEYVECGPGRVLSGLIRRIDKSAEVCNIQDVESLKRCVSE